MKTPEAYALAREAVVNHGARQKSGELAALLMLLDGIEPKVILEIGCDVGGTLYAWGKMAPTVIGVDITTQATTVRPAIEPHGATLVDGDSRDASTLKEVKRVLADRPVDMLFIDGDHSFESVRSDFEKYSPLVGDGGLIVIHDIYPHVATDPDDSAAHVEVPAFWRHLLSRNILHMEIYSSPSLHWGGMGVLFPPLIRTEDARELRDGWPTPWEPRTEDPATFKIEG